MSEATKPYFVLLVRNNEKSRWGIAFGDYVRGVVKAEEVDTYRKEFKAKNCLIIKVKTDLQVDIDACIAALNIGVPA